MVHVAILRKSQFRLELDNSLRYYAFFFSSVVVYIIYTTSYLNGI